MARRGHWLEAAVEASAETYRTRRQACIQKVATPAHSDPRTGRFYRTASTVDFIGVFKGLAVAFDAKATKAGSLPHKNVHAHQVEFLENWRRAGGIGFLLVSFESAATTFAAAINWYSDEVDRSARASLPFAAFAAAAADTRLPVCHVQHGANGLPIDFGPAIDYLNHTGDNVA